MLTKNGIKCIKNIIRQNAYETVGSSYVTEETDITVKKTDGTDVSITNMWGQYAFPQIEALNLFYPTPWYPGAGLIFGSDATPPTENDYSITPINSSSQSINKISARSYSDANGVICSEAIYQYINGDSTSRTINEFGLFSGFTNSSSSGYTMVYRDVFDEPIVIPPKSIKYIKVIVKMSI